MIGFDFDETICNTTVACELAAKELFGYNISCTEFHKYYLHQCFPFITKEQEWAIVKDMLSYEKTLMCPPLDGSMEFLEWFAAPSEYYKTGRDIIIITNRENEIPVFDFMDKHLPADVDRDKIIIYCEKNKGPLAKSLGLRYFLDDYIGNVISLLNYGVTPIIFEQLWNKNYLTDRSLVRGLSMEISSWEEMYCVIDCIEKNHGKHYSRKNVASEKCNDVDWKGYN